MYLYLSPPPSSPLLAARPVHHRFYVYCKSPCNAMRPGKLRVRCADCKGTSFVLLGVCFIYMTVHIGLSSWLI